MTMQDVQMRRPKVRAWVVGAAVMCGVVAAVADSPATPQAPQTPPQQPSEVAVVISGDPGTPPRYAVPDFVAANPESADIAKTISQVLWDDLAFEREFYLIPRDTYATIPSARTGRADSLQRVA